MLVKASALLLLGALIGYAVGAYAAAAAHGDWIIMRKDGGCAAYDPRSTSIAGQWPVRADGICHMSDFILKKVF